MIATGTAQTPRALRRGTLIASCLAVCLAQIALAIPATLNGLFQEDLHPVGSQLTWISDAFLLPVTVLELTFGVLGDLFGRKRLLVGGAFLMAIGELVSATAGGIPQLWAGQILSGVAGAAIFPTTLAMVAAGTQTHRDRASGIAVWAAALSSGGFIAPMLGGITATYGSWAWSFIVVMVLSLLVALVSLLFAENSIAPEGRSLDWGGQITVLIGLCGLLYGVIQGQSDGWAAPSVIIAFAIAVVFIALFVYAESRARSPLLRLELFRNRAFAVASIIAVVGMFSFLGTAYATSIRLGPIQHLNPLVTGAAFLLLNGLTLLLMPITRRLLETVNPRTVLTVGLGLIAVGDFWAATIGVHDTSLVPLIVPLAFVGVGFALAVSSITAVAVNTVPIHFTGMASAATSLLRDFGFTLGPAIIGAVALGRASSLFATNLATADLPTQVKEAAIAVAQNGGPLAVNSVPPSSPPGHAASIAVSALGQGYAIGYVVCGAAALVSALLAVLALRGGKGDTVITEVSLAEDTATH